MVDGAIIALLHVQPCSLEHISLSVGALQSYQFSGDGESMHCTRVHLLSAALFPYVFGCHHGSTAGTKPNRFNQIRDLIGAHESDIAT